MQHAIYELVRSFKVFGVFMKFRGLPFGDIPLGIHSVKHMILSVVTQILWTVLIGLFILPSGMSFLNIMHSGLQNVKFNQSVVRPLRCKYEEEASYVRTDG